jgi:hypothetical protein
MLIVCTGCGWNREVHKKRLQGKVIYCPECGEVVEIPLESGTYLSALYAPTPLMIVAGAVVAVLVCSGCFTAALLLLAAG